MPWSYVKEGKNVGYDIDLVVRFCRDRGYALELVQQILLPRMPELRIRIVIEHAAQESGATVTITYSGEAFDPRSSDNELSLKVMESAAEEIAYSFDPAAAEENTVRIRIRS